MVAREAIMRCISATFTLPFHAASVDTRPVAVRPSGGKVNSHPLAGKRQPKQITVQVHSNE